MRSVSPSSTAREDAHIDRPTRYRPHEEPEYKHIDADAGGAGGMSPAPPQTCLRPTSMTSYPKTSESRVPIEMETQIDEIWAG